MRVLPILFNTEMVRAILDGRKGCTRRLVKPQQFVGMLPDKCKNALPDEFLKEKRMMFKPYCDMTDSELISTAYNSPYQTGDILYVRETWCDDRQFTHDSTPGRYFYKASENGTFKWEPSIHMPKEAARIWLKVTDVRVEQLQDITEDEAKAEGMPGALDYPVAKIYCPRCNGIGTTDSINSSSLGHEEIDCRVCDSFRKRFRNFWNATIEKKDYTHGWDANPYVWVTEFERCEKPEVN